MSGKHEGCKRQFRHLSRAWYGPHCLKNAEYLEEIMIGMYQKDGGTTGEFAIRWMPLNGRGVPQLCVYNDAWDALLEFSDLLVGLKAIDGQGTTPEEMCDILLSFGIEDATPVESPYGGKS